MTLSQPIGNFRSIGGNQIIDQRWDWIFIGETPQLLAYIRKAFPTIRVYSIRGGGNVGTSEAGDARIDMYGFTANATIEFYGFN